MTEKRFNCHVKFSAMPNGIMVLDYERHGDEQTVIEDISREKAHRVMDRLNELNDENEQLKKEINKIKNILLNKKKDLECDYNRAAKAGMPTGGTIGELDTIEDILEEMGLKND